MSGHTLFPWQIESAPEHIKNRQPVMELPGPRGVRVDLPRRRPADELPRSLQGISHGVVVMSHRGYSNGRLSVLLSSIPENYPVVVSSDSIAEEDIEGDRKVALHHGADFSHCTPWGGRARNAIHCMECTDWRVTLYLSDDVWLFPEATRDGLRWFVAIEQRGVPLAVLGYPGWETYRDHPRWGFSDWTQCLLEPQRFEAVPPNPHFMRGPSLYKNPFGACMLMNRVAYDELGGFASEYWAHDDVYNHKVWASFKWVNAMWPGRGYMHLGAQSWHHGESVEYVGAFEKATGMTIEESGVIQVRAIEMWKKQIGEEFLKLGGTEAL